LEVPTSITLKAGEEQSVTLPGLGSAGYTWIWDVEGTQDCVSLRLESAGGAPASGHGIPQGGSVDSLLVVRGLRPCSVTIRLAQRRPWEKGRPPLRELSVSVTVTGS
jgi:hypothetical protein